jgi:hypothetical protein
MRFRRNGPVGRVYFGQDWRQSERHHRNQNHHYPAQTDTAFSDYHDKTLSKQLPSPDVHNAHSMRSGLTRRDGKAFGSTSINPKFNPIPL